jgi:hypothetical protein
MYRFITKILFDFDTTAAWTAWLHSLKSKDDTAYSASGRVRAREPVHVPHKNLINRYPTIA